MRLHKRKQLGFQRSKDFRLQEKTHIHVQLDRKADEAGNQHNQIHITKQKNEKIGQYHGILHRTASLRHRIIRDTPQILTDSRDVSNVKKAVTFTERTGLSAENAVIRHIDPVHADQRHQHVQFQQAHKNNETFRTNMHFVRLENQDVGTVHNDLPNSSGASAFKKAVKFMGHTALAAENAVIRRIDPVHADQRHWHVQFQRTQQNDGTFRTKMHFVRLENQSVGTAHGVFHRAASLRHRIIGDTSQILSNSTTVSAVKKTAKFTGHVVLAAENAVIRHRSPALADQRHWHVQFQRTKDDSGKFHTKVHLKRVENEHVGNYHGILHRMQSMRNRIIGDTPQFFSDSKAVSAVKKTIKFTGHVALAAENAVIRRIDPMHADQRHWQMRFERIQDDDGNFHTKMRLVRKEIPNLQKSRGILHKVVGVKHRFSGEVPSLTKRLKASQPATFQGALIKSIALGAVIDAKLLTKLGTKTALGAENVTITATDIAQRKIRQKIADKYHSEAVDDSNRGLLASGKIAKDALVGFQRYRKQKATLRQEQQRLVEKKKQIRLTAAKANQQLKNSTLRFLHKKEDFSLRKAAFTAAKLDGTVSKLQKTAFKRRKHVYRFEKKKFRKWEKSITKIQKAETKSVTLQKKLVKKSKPTPLLIQPLVYAGRRTKTETWQKAISADANNDFMRVANAGIQVASNLSIYTSQSQRKYKKGTKQAQKMQKKQQSKEKKSSKFQGKLKQQEYRLQQSQTRKQQKKKQKNHKRVVNKKLTIKDRFRRSFHQGIEQAAKKLLIPALPILFGLLIFLLVLQIIFGTFSNSGFIMGTYAARDDALTSSEMYYTRLADTLNKKVIQLNSTDQWKNILQQLGVSQDTLSTYEDTPTEFIFGQSSVFPDEPAYDFDCYKLWSFLCAYYYDFDAAEEAAENGEDFDVPYWEYGDETTSILRDLFELEYTFDYHYDNTSHWQELSSYTYDGIYHWITDSGIKNNYGYVDFVVLPDDLNQFSDENRVYFNYNNGEILDFNDNYAATGFYFQDQRSEVTDPSGMTISSFYQYDPSAYQSSSSNGYGKNYVINGEDVWMPKSYWSFTMEDGRSFQDVFCVEVAPNDVAVWKYRNEPTVNGYIGYLQNLTSTNLYYDAWDRDLWIDICVAYGEEFDGYYGYGFSSYYQKYEWVEDCRLYYTVHQNCTFDEAIRQILSAKSDGEERLDYYALLSGSGSIGSTSNLLGNHQSLSSPVDEGIVNLLNGNWIYNGYGYDMQEWNSTHCDISRHTGIDIIRNSGSSVYAMLTGKITNYDEDTHTVTLESTQKVDYWYDKDRKTRIIYSNVILLGALQEGDTVTAGDKIGVTTSDRKCKSQSNAGASCDYLHVEVWIKYYYIQGDNNYKAADPRLLIDY